MSPPTKGLTVKTTPVKLKPFEAEEDEPEEEGAVGGIVAAPEDVGIAELVDREFVIEGGVGEGVGVGSGLVDEEGKQRRKAEDKEAEVASGLSVH